MLVVPLFWCETAVYNVNSVGDVNSVCFCRPQASIFHVKQNRWYHIQTFILFWLDLSQSWSIRTEVHLIRTLILRSELRNGSVWLKAHQRLQRLHWSRYNVHIFFRLQIKTDPISFEFLKLWLRKINVLLKFTIITPECDESISNPENKNPSSLSLNADSLLLKVV